MKSASNSTDVFALQRPSRTTCPPDCRSSCRRECQMLHRNAVTSIRCPWLQEAADEARRAASAELAERERAAEALAAELAAQRERLAADCRALDAAR